MGRCGHGRRCPAAYTGSRQHHPDAHRSLRISYLTPLLAIVTGIVHAGLAPVIVVADVKPNLVLVAVVLVTSFFGFLPGIVWAFVAGLTANLLVGDPLGSLPLVLLVVAALVAGGHRLLGRLTWVYPVLAALVGSIVADVLGLLLFSLVAEPVQTGIPMEIVLPAAFLNAAIVGVLAYPTRLASVRYTPQEGGAW